MATKEHTFYCFDTLLWKLQGYEIKVPQFENERYPLFVTWNTIKGSGEELRGCIGNFSPIELYSGLREYALTRETIESLLRKAGYKGNVNKVLDQLSVVRYKSSKSHATYQEYINR
ncbi:AMME syndrome candidate protein 1 protein [Boothiomyces sp. JEL0838]|nr:AMME syndrome candidate protein 1 protein [Boothiomyces sp. JEL0838]